MSLPTELPSPVIRGKRGNVSSAEPEWRTQVETPQGWEDYITASRYTWYADLSVTDSADKPKPPPAPIPLPEGSERQAREQALRATGWCLIDSLSAGSLWGPCGSSR